MNGMSMGADWLAQLRCAGVRPTPTRLGVLQILADGRAEWLRGEEVLRRMLERGWPANMTSVYRAIRALERAGLLEQQWMRGRGSPRAVFRCRLEDGTREGGVCERSDHAGRTALRLFRRMHDAPSAASAEELVRWLGEDARNVLALDDALTLWALAGAALVRPALDEARRHGGVLQ
ncbi:transcriptional repressor [Variovorax sp. DT-64]|uniref:transcriptional repressor n=1 Tax=Variovorax sp. DT-64 TaxID=3396160 RepID=UPI003F1DEF35